MALPPEYSIGANRKKALQNRKKSSSGNSRTNKTNTGSSNVTNTGNQTYKNGNKTNQVGTNKKVTDGITVSDTNKTNVLNRDMTSDIKKIQQAKKNQQIAGLKDRMRQKEREFAEVEAGIKPRYEEERRRVGAQNALSRKRFGDFLAERGLARSGESAQARLMSQSSLQGNLGALGQQKQQEMDRLARDRMTMRQQYQDDIGRISGDISLQEAQMLMNERLRQDQILREDQLRKEALQRDDMLRDRANNLRYAEQLGVADPFGGRRLTDEEIAMVSPFSQDFAARMQVETDPRMLELLNIARMQKTMGDPRLGGTREIQDLYGRDYMGVAGRQNQEQQFAQRIANDAIPDYQQAINDVANDGIPNNDWQIPILQAERERKLERIRMKDQQLAATMRSQTFEDIEAAMNLWNQMGIANEFVANILDGVEVGEKSTSYTFALAEQKLNEEKERRIREQQAQQIAISQQNANIAQQRANIAAQAENRLQNQSSNTGSASTVDPDVQYSFPEARSFLETEQFMVGSGTMKKPNKDLQTQGLADLVTNGYIEKEEFEKTKNYHNLTGVETEIKNRLLQRIEAELQANGFVSDQTDAIFNEFDVDITEKDLADIQSRIGGE